MRDVALKRLKDLINNSTTHPFYRYVVELSNEYKAYITGEGIGRYLKRFNPRENEEMFKQRVRLTNSINPAIMASLRKPFSRVSRITDIKREIKVKSDNDYNNIKKAIHSFNNNPSFNIHSNGLDEWLKDDFKEITFTDPNAWLLLEYEAKNIKEDVYIRPRIIYSEEAINYTYLENGALDWIYCNYAINYTSLVNDELVIKSGIKYILYDREYTISIENVCYDAYKANQITLLENQTIEIINNNYYIISFIENKLNSIPIIRIGYIKDIATKNKTYISPIHPAIAYLRSGLKLNSEYDLTLALHAFPQKYEYVEKCKGFPELPCTNGKVLSTGKTCEKCHGSGKNIITTAQEVKSIVLDEDKENRLPLSEYSYYQSPPNGILEFQYKALGAIEPNCHYAVFNSSLFVTKTTQVEKTATEVNVNVDGITDVIAPFTEKISKIWITSVYFIAKIVGAELDNESRFIHRFPPNLKLITEDVLLNQLSILNNSGAPSYMIDYIQTEIMKKRFDQDEIRKKQFEIRHLFFPFNGKRESEINFLLASQYVSDRNKILYANFESIFNIIEEKYPLFPFSEYNQQLNILNAEIDNFVKNIDEEKDNNIIDERLVFETETKE